MRHPGGITDEASWGGLNAMTARQFLTELVQRVRPYTDERSVAATQRTPRVLRMTLAELNTNGGGAGGAGYKLDEPAAVYALSTSSDARCRLEIAVGTNPSPGSTRHWAPIRPGTRTGMADGARARFCRLRLQAGVTAAADAVFWLLVDYSDGQIRDQTPAPNISANGGNLQSTVYGTTIGGAEVPLQVSDQGALAIAALDAAGTAIERLQVIPEADGLAGGARSLRVGSLLRVYDQVTATWNRLRGSATGALAIAGFDAAGVWQNLVTGAGAANGGTLRVIGARPAVVAQQAVAINTGAAQLLLAASTARASVLVHNAGPGVLHVGSAAVSAANSPPLEVGQSEVIDCTAALYATATIDATSARLRTLSDA